MTQFASFFDRLAESRRMAHLFSLSDRELAIRGLNRDALKRQYISSIGAN